MRPAPGEVIGGKYRIVRMIGDGGMGTVYEAHHELLDAQVALKFLHADLAKRPGLGSRFLQEARVSARIHSVHVAHVTDVDQTADGSPYLVMELLHGESLQAALDRLHKLSPEQAIDFALQILSGLESAHHLGVVHRDLKPDNVFIVPAAGGPLLKLIDFGIAKLRAATEYQKGLTRAGVVMGTPEYMAPEQLFAASDVDHRADLYSLGVLLFEMLAGRRPVDGDDVETIIAAVVSGKVRRLRDLEPSLPPGLLAVVDRALMPDRDQRFASALDMRLALAPFAGALSQAGRIAATPEPVHPPSRSTPAPAPAMQTGVAQEFHATRAVPKTLPPEAPEGAMLKSGKGSTQEVSDAEVREALRASASALPPADLAYAPTASAYGPPPQPILRKRKSRAGLWVTLLLLILLLGGGGVFAALYYQPDAQPTASGPLFAADTATAPPAVVSPLIDTGTPGQVTPTAKAPAAVTPSRPLPNSPTPARPATPGTAKPADAGAPPAVDGGQSGTFPFPFALPSTLPPLPSTFPPLPKTFPSGLPTALPPGFPQFPGFPFGAPAPANSK